MAPWYDLIVNTDITVYGVLHLSIFPVIVSIGIGFGILWSVWPVAAIPDLARSRLEAGTTALVGAVICGRIGYVLVNWVYFQKNLTEIAQVMTGGISWLGAVIGGISAILITASIRQTSFLELVDGLRPLLASIVVSSWLASWMTGYAYGVAVDTLLGIPARDEWGLLSKRWPVQLVGAFSALGFHWASDQLQARKWRQIPGMTASLELGGLFFTVAALSPFRADPAPRWAGIHIDTWASIILVLMCAIASISLYSRNKK